MPSLISSAARPSHAPEERGRISQHPKLNQLLDVLGRGQQQRVLHLLHRARALDLFAEETSEGQRKALKDNVTKEYAELSKELGNIPEASLLHDLYRERYAGAEAKRIVENRITKDVQNMDDGMRLFSEATRRRDVLLEKTVGQKASLQSVHDLLLQIPEVPAPASAADLRGKVANVPSGKDILDDAVLTTIAAQGPKRASWFRKTFLAQGDYELNWGDMIGKALQRARQKKEAESVRLADVLEALKVIKEEGDRDRGTKDILDELDRRKNSKDFQSPLAEIERLRKERSIGAQQESAKPSLLQRVSGWFGAKAAAMKNRVSSAWNTWQQSRVEAERRREEAHKQEQARNRAEQQRSLQEKNMATLQAALGPRKNAVVLYALDLPGVEQLEKGNSWMPMAEPVTVIGRPDNVAPNAPGHPCKVLAAYPGAGENPAKVLTQRYSKTNGGDLVEEWATNDAKFRGDQEASWEKLLKVLHGVQRIQAFPEGHPGLNHRTEGRPSTADAQKDGPVIDATPVQFAPSPEHIAALNACKERMASALQNGALVEYGGKQWKIRHIGSRNVHFGDDRSTTLSVPFSVLLDAPVTMPGQAKDASVVLQGSADVVPNTDAGEAVKAAGSVPTVDVASEVTVAVPIDAPLPEPAPLDPNDPRRPTTHLDVVQLD